MFKASMPSRTCSNSSLNGMPPQPPWPPRPTCNSSPADVVDLVDEFLDADGPLVENDANGDGNTEVDVTARPAIAAHDVEIGFSIPAGEIHVGESSRAVLGLDLSLGVVPPKRSALHKTIRPVFVKKLVPTHITYELTIPKSFWETNIRKPHGSYEFKFHMGSLAWEVVIKFKKARVRVIRGWDDFVEANGIDVGMILRLELLTGRKTHFLVTVR